MLMKVYNFLEKTEYILTECDDRLVRQLIQNIHVVNISKIDVVFKSGIVIQEYLSIYNSKQT